MSGKTTWRQHLTSFFSWGWRSGPGPVPAEKIELPLTPAHIFALRHHVRSERQTNIGFIAAGVTFALLLPAIPFERQAVPVWFGLVVGGCIAGLCVLVDWLGWRRGHEAELRQGVYYRVSGPIRSSMGSDRGSVQVGDVTIKHISNITCRKLRDLPFGYVDYAPRSRLILEQRDADGELLYRDSAYRPDDDPAVTRRLPSLTKACIWGAGSCIVSVLSLLALFAWAESRR